MEDIREIVPAPSPFDPDEKMFCFVDEEGNELGEKISLREWYEMMFRISGVNEELLGNEN